MFFIGICHASYYRFYMDNYENCLEEKYHIKPDRSTALLLLRMFNTGLPLHLKSCKRCDPGKDRSCISTFVCARGSTPNDLLVKYKDCGTSASKFIATSDGNGVSTGKYDVKKEPEHGEIGGRCYQWRYCNGAETRCDEHYKCVYHGCKKEGEVPNGPDDKCCMPMITKQGSPCKLLNTDHSDYNCNSHRKCQLNHEGRDYVCCYSHSRKFAPECVKNKDCGWGDLYSQWP